MIKRCQCLVLLIFLGTSVSLSETAVKETYMVPMRDGTILATDVYRPNNNNAHPIILYRTPYNKDDIELSATHIALLNALGYVFVAQDCRGRYASEGVDSVFITDGWGALQDGYDTIDWIANQNWCNGKVGQFGGSATGITTYRAAASLHPNLTCAVAAVAPSDFYHQVVYPGGEFRKSICENWVHGQGSDYIIDYFLNYPYYDNIWKQMNLHTRTHMMKIPIAHFGGWYDCFSDGTVKAFMDLHSQPLAGPQKLVMGPWPHGTTGESSSVGDLTYPDSKYDYISYLILWLDYWLRDTQNGILDSPDVKYYLMGAPEMPDEIGCEWLEADTWPPENVALWDIFLSHSYQLQNKTSAEGGEVSFNYDPADPVPTKGGNNLTIDAGPYDQRSINQRADVIQFTSDALVEPVRVEGFVKGVLYISSNCPDTDLTLKLIDVYPDGREMLVTDGIQRVRFRNGYQEENVSFLSAGEIVPIEIALPPTAIVFNSDHRIQICISSSNTPRFEVNPNTANEPNDRSNPQVATNTVYFGGDYPSKIILPVVVSETFVSGMYYDIKTYHLFNNYPNPFNNGTQIRFSLPQIEYATLSVFNISGQRIKVLAQGRLPAGDHIAHWDGRDEFGGPVVSGIYIYCLQIKDDIETKKMLLVR